MYVRVWNEGGLAQLLFAQTNLAPLVDYMEKEASNIFIVICLLMPLRKACVISFL